MYGKEKILSLYMDAFIIEVGSKFLKEWSNKSKQFPINRCSRMDYF